MINCVAIWQKYHYFAKIQNKIVVIFQQKIEHIRLTYMAKLYIILT